MSPKTSLWECGGMPVGDPDEAVPKSLPKKHPTPPPQKKSLQDTGTELAIARSLDSEVQLGLSPSLPAGFWKRSVGSPPHHTHTHPHFFFSKRALE